MTLVQYWHTNNNTIFIWSIPFLVTWPPEDLEAHVADNGLEGVHPSLAESDVWPLLYWLELGQFSLKLQFFAEGISFGAELGSPPGFFRRGFLTFEGRGSGESYFGWAVITHTWSSNFKFRVTLKAWDPRCRSAWWKHWCLTALSRQRAWLMHDYLDLRWRKQGQKG